MLTRSHLRLGVDWSMDKRAFIAHILDLKLEIKIISLCSLPFNHQPLVKFCCVVWLQVQAAPVITGFGDGRGLLPSCHPTL